MKTLSAQLVCWLALFCLFPILASAKSNPKTLVKLSEEREKQTLIGTVTLKGDVYISGSGYETVTDKIWHDAHLEGGTLTKDFTFRGITIPADSWLYVRDDGRSVNVRIRPSKDMSIGGIVFDNSEPIRFRLSFTRDLVGGVPSVRIQDSFNLSGKLKNHATIGGLPVKAGQIDLRGDMRWMGTGNPSSFEVRLATISRDTMLFGDISIKAGETVRYGRSFTASNHRYSENWLNLGGNGYDRTIRGHKHVKFFSIDTRTRRIVKLHFNKPAIINGIPARNVEYYASGAVYKIQPFEGYTKWKGMILEGPIKFWENGSPQEINILSHKSVASIHFSRDIETYKGIQLDGVSRIRLNQKGEIKYIYKMHNNRGTHFSVDGTKLTILPGDSLLRAPSSYYHWIHALKQ